MQICITEAIARKLKEKHNVSEAEVMQCCKNKTGKFAQDTRAEEAGSLSKAE
jgi:hypothetical protein